jgi:release factor glutamine methyltransferase
MSRVGELIDEGVAALAAVGRIDNPRGEARMLLAVATGWETATVFGYPEREVPDDASSQFRAFVGRRVAGEPAAHITGVREFWSLPFRVTADTLVPRPDTEAVIELALQSFEGRPKPEALLDLGTGTGCLLLALLSEFQSATGVGLDISRAALAVAKENAERLDLAERAAFSLADFAEAPEGPFDLIVSNPPYIASADIADLEIEVRKYDPHAALDGGADGLDAYRAIFQVAPERLTEDGILIFEVGAGQASDVQTLGEKAGMVLLSLRKDLAGIERALAFCKKGVGIPGAAG